MDAWVLSILQRWQGDQGEFVWYSVENTGSEEQGGWRGWDAGIQNTHFSKSCAAYITTR